LRDFASLFACGITRLGEWLEVETHAPRVPTDDLGSASAFNRDSTLGKKLGVIVPARENSGQSDARSGYFWLS
jgi:hypothetical protein